MKHYLSIKDDLFTWIINNNILVVPNTQPFNAYYENDILILLEHDYFPKIKYTKIIEINKNKKIPDKKPPIKIDTNKIQHKYLKGLTWPYLTIKLKQINIPKNPIPKEIKKVGLNAIEFIKLLKTRPYKHLNLHYTSEYNLNLKKLKRFYSNPTKRYGIKPYGLWYSCGPSWLEAYYFKQLAKLPDRTKQTYMLGGYTNYLYSFKINKSKFIKINNKQKIIKFSKGLWPTLKDYIITASYSRSQQKKYNLQIKDYKIIDWLKIYNKYHGFEVCPYYYEFSKTMYNDAWYWYAGLDAASGCVWDIRDIISVELIAINVKNLFYLV